MKKRFFLMAGLVLLVAVSWAQQMPQMPKLPIDPKTRIGKLDNGLTYYIRHNEYPAKVANFYIAQRVGSIQENDDQRGLAHFLEHMAFNGSNHFKGNGIIDFTRSLGVAFGQDLNAYTSIERTVYNIDNVPTTRQSALDSCLLVLQDWSNGLLLEDEEIDKERGVIHGEWAMRNSANQRLIERNLPKMYPDCKYGERLPIGLMSIVDSFPYDALRKYYQKWYHPENQAIIVVGDIDVDHTEAAIKEIFSGIKAGPDAAHVEAVPVPDNNEAIFISDHDKEMKTTDMSIMLKSEALPKEMKGTMAEVSQDYLTGLICTMFNSRMREVAEQPECPFTELSMGYGSYLLSSTKDAASFDATAKDGKASEAYAAMIREIRRMGEFGFTGGEFVRAKEEILSQLEKEYSNRNKQKDKKYIRACVENYLDGDAMPDAETEYQIYKMIAQQIPVELVNQMIGQMITIDNDTNMVSYVFQQEKEGAKYLEPEEMRQILNNVRQEKLTAWVDNAKDEPLISKEPKAGKIKSEEKNETLGFTTLTLSNGAKVVLKKTDFKDDEVLLYGFAPGGKCMYGESDFTNLKIFDAVSGTFGLGNFTNNELEKALAGKQAGCGVELGNQQSSVSGHATPKDVETMLQLLYLQFTAPQKDEKSYQSLMGTMETQLKNRDLMPEAQLSDSIQAVISCNNPRTKNLTAEDLQNVSLDRCLAIQKERFSNVNNFAFTIIGNFDETTIRPLICKYIASLPGKEKAVKTADIRTLFNADRTCDFKRKMETPKPYIIEVYETEGKTTQQQRILGDVAGEVLSMVLLKSVREDAGAAYSVGAMFGDERAMPTDKEYQIMQIYAPISAPEKLDSALYLIQEGVKEVCVKADPDMVAKVKANFLKDADVNAKKNSYWQGVITNWYIYGEDKYSNLKTIIESVTPEQVSAQLKKIVDGCHAVVVMRPE